jgi:hypothetical protein
MLPDQETMRGIAKGGDGGRRAFLRIWITAAIASDFCHATEYCEEVLPTIWKEQDRTGDKNWPQEDRDLLLFIMRDITEAMSMEG